MNNINKRLENLENYCRDLERRNNEMSTIINDIFREIKALKSESTETGAVFKGQSSPVSQKSRLSSSNQIPLSKTAQPQTNIVKSSNVLGEIPILQAYNKILECKGNDLKLAREAFENQYKVIGISCVNYEERVNSPNTPPIFQSEISLAKAHLWLIRGNGKYLAFLNPSKGYDNQIHDNGGMKFVFESNYKGGYFNSFNLQRPAIFQNLGGVWRIVQKGRIIL